MSYAVRKPVRKRNKRFKPYWDDELSELWQCMRVAEKRFIKCNGSNRVKKQLHLEFKNARRTFDKKLRTKERTFRRKKINEIDCLNSKNPK